MEPEALSALTSPHFGMPESQDPDTPPPAQTEPTVASEQRVLWWISPPPLDFAEKLKYKELEPVTSGASSSGDEGESPVEVVGDIRLGTDLYYWVVHESDIVHRVSGYRVQCLSVVFNAFLTRSIPQKSSVAPMAILLKRTVRFLSLTPNHTRLIRRKIVERRDQGLLEVFDPQSPRVYPQDRIDLKIVIPAKNFGPALSAKRAVLSRAAKRVTVAMGASDGETEDSQPEYDSGSDVDTDEPEFKVKGSKKIQQPMRRSARAAVSNSMENYCDTSPGPAKTRANPKRLAGRNADDTYHDDDSSEEDYDETGVSDGEPKPKKKKINRGRLSRPAYGNIRQVADLSSSDSDDETAALHVHRDTCEKCQEPAAHRLLKKYYNRGRKTGRKKAKADDDFEENDEEQRLLSMGGWVRWCVHFRSPIPVADGGL